MNKKNIIIFVGSVVASIAFGVLVYYLRVRSNEGLLVEFTSVQKVGVPGVSIPSVERAPRSAVTDTQGLVEPPQEIDMGRIWAAQTIKAQYSDEEYRYANESNVADAKLPDDLTKTWSPEFHRQLEQRQAARR